MRNRFRRSKKIVVEFCDRCTSVCDAVCRGNAVRDHVRDKALRYRARLS